MTELVTVERGDAEAGADVAIVTLNMPAKRNALSLDLREALFRALETLTADATCRAIVLTGAGGTFCAGGDLSSMPEGDPLGARTRMRGLHRTVRLIVAGPKPVIAAVEGYAYGAGMSLAAACDHVVAADNAKFCASFGKVGLVPDAGLLWSLPQRVGLGRAKELMILGEAIDGREAARIGLADRLAAPGAALSEALRRARLFAAAAPAATALTKSALARAPAALDAMLEIEIDAQSLLFGTEDHAEGKAAFFGKRSPVFKGR